MSSVPNNKDMDFERKGSMLDSGSGSDYQPASKFDKKRLFGN